MLRSLTVLLIAALLPAQQVPAQRSLTDVQKAFYAQWTQLHEGGRPGRDKEHELLGRQAEELVQFLLHEAKGDDRWNGRLMLADLRMGLGDRDAAVKALGDIDAAVAPGLVLLTAADMAAHLEAKELRDSLVGKALQKPAPLADQLAMARLLLTTLHEIESGEKLFQSALAAAVDDEERAMVRWHQADATRDREDLAEASKAYYDLLERLAAELPQTYWGSVARDRCKASMFKVGSEAIDFTAKTTAGDDLSLQALRGKVVLLVFWASDDDGAAQLVYNLQQLQQQNRDQLAIVGIARDTDLAALATRCKQLGADWPEICDGLGYMADLFLRYQVETVPTILVLDKQGRIAAMNLHTGTKDAVQELTETVARARKAS